VFCVCLVQSFNCICIHMRMLEPDKHCVCCLLQACFPCWLQPKSQTACGIPWVASARYVYAQFDAAWHLLLTLVWQPLLSGGCVSWAAAVCWVIDCRNSTGRMDI